MRGRGVLRTGEGSVDGGGDLGGDDAGRVGVALPGQVAVVGDAGGSPGGVDEFEGDVESVGGERSSGGAFDGGVWVPSRGGAQGGAGVEQVQDDAG